jgi:hypothetical protein
VMRTHLRKEKRRENNNNKRPIEDVCDLSQPFLFFEHGQQGSHGGQSRESERDQHHTRRWRHPPFLSLSGISPLLQHKIHILSFFPAETKLDRADLSFTTLLTRRG